MEQYLYLYIAIPFIALILNNIISSNTEKTISSITITSLRIQLLFTIVFIIFWILDGAKTLYSREFTFYQNEHTELFVDFSFDKITATYLFVGAFLAFLIMSYSRYYLHRESGFKRFFNTILFFYIGYNIIVLSGNLASFFIGWEIAGIASFLLIAFYRNRYIPVKNALKIFTMYRIGDVSLVIAIWTLHHIYHKNISLIEFENTYDVVQHIYNYPILSILFSCCILLAATIKSAQFPFSPWLSRAMEGPTPSSAIFYSSLSAHLGVLFLLRTHSFWEHIPLVKFLIIGVGVTTFILSSITLQVQSSIKGQIAYSAIAQIGLMFIETALGFTNLALVHFAGNSLLRSYQLLISPSIVTYLVREQFYSFIPTKIKEKTSKFKNTIYLLSFKEWNLDYVLYIVVWNFLKNIGKKLHKIPENVILIISGVLILSYFLLGSIVKFDSYVYSYIIAVFGILSALISFTEKKKIIKAVILNIIAVSTITCAVFISFHVELDDLLLFIVGLIVSSSLAIWSLYDLRKKEPKVSLMGYQGHCYEHPKNEFIFLLGGLGIMGFPASSAFLGLELIIGDISAYNFHLLIPAIIILFIVGLSMIRIYSRVFLGPHIKTYHEIARKSS